jgi:hypothetical protein
MADTMNNELAPRDEVLIGVYVQVYETCRKVEMLGDAGAQAYNFAEILVAAKTLRSATARGIAVYRHTLSANGAENG